MGHGLIPYNPFITGLTNMPKYFYNLADIVLELDLPFSLEVRQESVPFLTAPRVPNCKFLLRSADCIPLPASDIIWDEDIGSVNIDGSVCTYFRNGDEIVAFRKEETDVTTLEYLSKCQHYFISSHDLLNYLGVESLFLRHCAIMLHASFACWNGDGILFSAPCGTGKSTQAELWRRHLGAEIINGDRTAIRLINGEWIAYGIPYAGTSQIYKNKNAPIKAIVLLSKGPHNSIRALSPMQALRRVLPEVSIKRTDKSSVNGTMDLLLKLLVDVPVYALDCLPDFGAVDLLRETLYKG